MWQHFYGQEGVIINNISFQVVNQIWYESVALFFMLLEIKIGDEWNLDNSEVFHGQDLLYLVSVDQLLRCNN